MGMIDPEVIRLRDCEEVRMRSESRYRRVGIVFMIKYYKLRNVVLIETEEV